MSVVAMSSGGSRCALHRQGLPGRRKFRSGDVYFRVRTL